MADSLIFIAVLLTYRPADISSGRWFHMVLYFYIFSINISSECEYLPLDALCELHKLYQRTTTTLTTFSLYLVVNLESVLPKLYQHVNFATRRNNTLDQSETTQYDVKNTLNHFSNLPKRMAVRPEDANSSPQDCFRDTDCKKVAAT